MSYLRWNLWMGLVKRLKENLLQFMAIIPSISYAAGGREMMVEMRADEFYDEDKARFCVRFLTETSIVGEQISREADVTSAL